MKKTNEEQDKKQLTKSFPDDVHSHYNFTVNGLHHGSYKSIFMNTITDELQSANVRLKEERSFYSVDFAEIED